MTYEEVMDRLHALADPTGLEGQARYGIATHAALGIRMPYLRSLARETGRDHALAQDLWASGVHEARILASLVDVPAQVSEPQMEAWAGDIDSWDLCDQCCGNLFEKTPYAYDKVVEWSSREEEFVKRAAFSLMAQLATHAKTTPDEKFLPFLDIIKREAVDERNFVKKAVNWALRDIGKRSRALNEAAVDTAREISRMDSRAARWVAADALRELTNERVQGVLKR